jgi:radical SAM superfamily enzyme
LHVLKNTALADMEYSPLTMEEYFFALKKCIINIPSDVVIHRLTGDGDKKLLIKPLWSGDKHNVLNKLNKYMSENNVIQGSALNG